MKITGFDLNIPAEKAVAAAVKSGRLPHAVIIEGGTAAQRLEFGKKTAAALVCSSFNSPCGTCPHCIKSAADSHPDVLFYTVEDKPKAFKVDLVREIRGKAHIIPNEADKKVFLLENAHTMGVESQNAILKILEEPPSFVSFIMLAASKSVFLPTVLSRATVFSLGESENGSAEQSREDIIAAALGVAKAVASINDIDIVKAAAVFEKDAKLLRAALPVMQEIFAAALREKYNAAESNGEFGTLPGELAMKISGRNLLELVQALNGLMESVRMNANHNLMVTALCTVLRKAAK